MPHHNDGVRFDETGHADYPFFFNARRTRICRAPIQHSMVAAQCKSRMAAVSIGPRFHGMGGDSIAGH